jgi:hypothetical protein
MANPNDKLEGGIEPAGGTPTVPEKTTDQALAPKPGITVKVPEFKVRKRQPN